MGDEKPYTKREQDSLNEHIKGKLDLIHTQVITTNGRVTGLEKWRDKTIGALGVITFLIVPILLFIVKEWLGHF